MISQFLQIFTITLHTLIYTHAIIEWASYSAVIDEFLQSLTATLMQL